MKILARRHSDFERVIIIVLAVILVVGLPLALLIDNHSWTDASWLMIEIFVGIGFLVYYYLYHINKDVYYDSKNLTIIWSSKTAVVPVSKVEGVFYFFWIGWITYSTSLGKTNTIVFFPLKTGEIGRKKLDKYY